ncbi:MAG: magnesium/cobalt transporter CorA [Candidatus Cloacimonetes bacterium]|nr:magnesium/cobalt transporter CorA [Candidatus Cloacimonadota bacterium]
MARFYSKVSHKTGMVPGTLLHIGRRLLDQARISVFNYKEVDYSEKQDVPVESCRPGQDSSTVNWINVDGLHDAEIIGKLGESFNIHPLILEDILNTSQRPKYEDFDSYIFMVFKMLTYEEEKKEISSEQVSLILGQNFVITFQERMGDVFNGIRERIRLGTGRIRRMGADYLAYTLIDAVLDNYFVILEKIGERVEEIEEKLVTYPSPATLQEIHKLKQEMIYLRKSVWPLRELISGLERGESPLIMKSTSIFIRDIYDHTVQVIDTVETFRDMISGMLDIYLSSVSNRMNEIMKVLTIFAAIFIPLTFFAGVYGMNFHVLPELNWKWAYPAWWVLVLGIAGFMIYHFKKKKWM